MAYNLLQEGEDIQLSRYPLQPFPSNFWRRHMKWTTPSYIEMRFGFEVTMYIANR